MTPIRLRLALFALMAIVCRPISSTTPPFCSFYVERTSVATGRTIHTLATSSLDACLEECRSFGASCTGANFLLDLRNRPLCLLVDTRSPAAEADALSPHPSAVMYAAWRWCSVDAATDDYRTPPSGDTAGPCLNPRSEWSFERLARTNLLEERQEHAPMPYVISSRIGTSREACLHQCLQSPTCHSVLHSRVRNECRLLRISPHRVHSVGDHFNRDDEEWDLYESNCERVQHSPQHCAFVRRQNVGLADVFDVALVGNSSDWRECEQHCLDTIRLKPAKGAEHASMGAICRSYTFNQRSNACYLSHQSPGRMGINDVGRVDESLTSGELSDCQHFSLSCASNSLTLSSRSMRLFNGSVGVQERGSGAGAPLLCEQQVPGTFAFRVEIPFNEAECGLPRDALPSYSVRLMVREGADQRRGLVTHADKMVQVNCRMHQQAAHPTPLRTLPPLAQPRGSGQGPRRFELEQWNFTRPTLAGESGTSDANGASGDVSTTTLFPTPEAFDPLGAALKPQADAPASLLAYKLEVLDAGGRPADSVDMEDFGYLQISALPPPAGAPHPPHAPTDFTISELVAENLVDGRLVELIDSAGCVTNYAVVKSLEKWEPNSLRVGVLFSGFGDHARVTYQAMVRPCSLHTCAQECNRPLYEARAPSKSASRGDGDARRTIRAIVPFDGGWQSAAARRTLELHSHAYEVHSLTALRIGDEEGDEEVVRREMVSSGFQRCLHDENCLLTVLSFSVQLLLCLLCIFMVYRHVIARWGHTSPQAPRLFWMGEWSPVVGYEERQ